ncbi:MAG: hypothetical protein WBD22_01100 [Pyrinomonadaceae bacterium]
MFSALTKPNYPKAAIGFEQTGITALALQKERRRRLGIKQGATIALPDGLLQPSFLERNISNSSQFQVLLEEAAVTSGLMNQKRWSVSLPGNTARSAILTLDAEPKSKQETIEMIEWKAEQSFGASAGELRLTTRKITPDKDRKSRYFATAVKLSVIDEYESIFEGFGWKAGLILPRAVSEANWISKSDASRDSLLISSQNDGFTALLFRGDEPAVVRSVTCAENERDDEIYRLLMFYRDRVADENGGLLEKLLIIGKEISASRIREVSAEAMGRALGILSPEDVGLLIPANSLAFDDIAAPAGLAALGFR